MGHVLASIDPGVSSVEFSGKTINWPLGEKRRDCTCKGRRDSSIIDQRDGNWDQHVATSVRMKRATNSVTSSSRKGWESLKDEAEG